MASSFRSNPPAKPHSFLKIIMSDIGSGSKLMIPKKFVRKYGKDLGGRVFLKAPFGANWQVELERRNDEVWLQNGWQEFAAYYSICFGHVLVFRYEGDSLFHVTVFDKSASEVEYPMNDTNIEPTNQNRGVLQEEKELNEMDVHAVRVKESNPRRFPEMEKSIVPYSRSYKKKRASSVCEETNQTGGCWLRKMHEGAHASSTQRLKNKHTNETNNVVNQTERVSAFQSTCAQRNRMKPINLEVDLDSNGSLQEVKGKRVHQMQLVTEADEARTLESAKAFKSDNPFFKVVMNLSYLTYNVTLARSFVERYITKKTDYIGLQVTGRGTWLVKCILYPETTCAKLSAGWRAFAKDNHLVAGDVCVFEVINRPQKLLKVVIFRVTNYSSC